MSSWTFIDIYVVKVLVFMVLFLHLCHLHAFIKIILNTLDCT